MQSGPCGDRQTLTCVCSGTEIQTDNAFPPFLGEYNSCGFLLDVRSGFSKKSNNFWKNISSLVIAPTLRLQK